MSPWKIANNSITCSPGEWSLELDLTCPTRGLNVAHDGKTVWSILGVGVPSGHELAIEEAYARGDDFIVRFDQSDKDPFEFQLNWRLLPSENDEQEVAGQPPGIELWLSVQTDDLNSQPVLELFSQPTTTCDWTLITAQEMTNDLDFECCKNTGISNASSLELAAILGATSENDCHVAWLIEPTDQQHVTLKSEPADNRQRISLFDHFMEKGVIRRARMRCYFSQTPFTATQLLEVYRQFANSPLPLTA